MASDALPVLMVIADQQDFYYQEYGDTSQSDTTDPLPVLMVIADQQDFYYQEYGDTRQSDPTDTSFNQFTPAVDHGAGDHDTNDTTSDGRTIVFTGLEDETDTASTGQSDDLFF